MSTPSTNHLIGSFSEANYREFLESAPDALVLTNKTGAILFVNAQAESLFGYTRAELLGTPIEMLLPERFRGRHVGHRAGYTESPRFRPMGSYMGLYGVRKDGTEFSVDISLSYQQIENDLVILAAVRDVTERKRAEEEIQTLNTELDQRVIERTAQLKEANERLEAASRHKSEFLAHMSHELRTPLNSVLGFAELLQDPTFGALSEKQARYAHNIHASGKHLLALIGDLLDLSKVEAGKLDLRYETLTLAETLEAALHIMRPQAEVKGLALYLTVDAALPPLTADPLRFTQILYNLLSNAVKFTPEGGRVTVTARRAGREAAGSGRQEAGGAEFVEIAVTDTGIGIKPDDLSRLFQEFVRLDTAIAQRAEGTGLGLALTKKLVELHGGEISAASEGEDRGSTFTVRLPLITST